MTKNNELASHLDSSCRSIRPEVFFKKGVLKICSKFTGAHPSRSVISTKSQSNFIKIALRHGCSPVNLLHIFRTTFPKNTSGRLLLQLYFMISIMKTKLHVWKHSCEYLSLNIRVHKTLNCLVMLVICNNREPAKYQLYLYFFNGYCLKMVWHTLEILQQMMQDF